MLKFILSLFKSTPLEENKFALQHKPRTQPPNYDVRRICEKIGEFYLNQTGGNYDETAEQIRKLQITHISRLESGEIEIHAARLGLLIGKKGENIGLLSKWLGSEIKLYEDNCWTDFLTPMDYNHYERDWYESDPELPKEPSNYSDLSDDSGWDHY